MSFLSSLGKIAGIAGAPFTGGASLALTGLSLGTDIFNTIQGNRAIGRALTQQLSGMDTARGDITKAQGGAESILESGQQTALEAGYEGLAQNLGETAPYTTAGGNAAYALSNYQSPTIGLTPTSFNFDPSKVTEDPGTKFIMDQAAQTLSRSAAGRGALRSGGTQKDLADYLTNLSSTLYGDTYKRQFNTALTRYQTENEQNVQQYRAGQENAGNQFNRLFSLTGMGLNAAGRNIDTRTNTYNRFMGLDEDTARAIAESRLQTGGNFANLSLAGGQARAAATLGKTNNLISGVNNIGYDLSSLLKNRKRAGNTGDVEELTY